MKLSVLPICAFLLFLSACGPENISGKGTDTPNPGIVSDDEIAASKYVLLADDDTNSKQLYPDENKGDSERVDIWNYPEQNKYGFIRFGLSDFSGHRIKSAHLHLYFVNVIDPGDISISKVRGDWDENILTYENSNTLSFSYLETVTVSRGDEKTYKVIDITSLVQSWVNGEVSNDGLAFFPESDRVRVEFNSKESSLNSSYLEIESY